MKSFHLVSLGCAKNLVDSELMLGNLMEAGYELEKDVELADIIIINTCGFIQPAVEEAIDEILQHASLKEDDPEKKLVVTGCLVQRYKDSLIQELPEVDLFLGTEGPHRIVDYLTTLSSEKNKLYLPDRVLINSTMPRCISTPFFRSWVKITEGCNNRCSYCMIPSIRGNLRSRPIADLLVEVQRLEASGVKEICLIAQDLTAYGDDLGEQENLQNLLKNILSKTSIPWIRLLYLYPTGIEDELLDIIAENPRITPYLDIPFQHVNKQVLKGMNRRYGQEFLFQLVEKMRKIIPDLALRTTFLLGFPGETEQHIIEVEDFIKEVQFDHLGVFPYANEAGCPSEYFKHQLDEEEKQRRVDHILAVQSEISQAKLSRFVGKTEKVLVEGVSRETDLLLEGRTRYQAPEIDGCVYITDGKVNQGDIVDVKITQAQVYDLVGKVINSNG